MKKCPKCEDKWELTMKMLKCPKCDCERVQRQVGQRIYCPVHEILLKEVEEPGTFEIRGFDVEIDINGATFLSRTIGEAIRVAEAIAVKARKLRPCGKKCKWWDSSPSDECGRVDTCDDFNSGFEAKPVEIEEKLFQLKCPECEKKFFMKRRPVADAWRESFECQYCSQYITVAMPDRCYVGQTIPEEEEIPEKCICDAGKLKCPACEKPMAPKSHLSEPLDLSEPLELMRDNLACPMCEHFEVCKYHPLPEIPMTPVSEYRAGTGTWDIHHALAMNCRYFKFDVPWSEQFPTDERSENE